MKMYMEKKVWCVTKHVNPFIFLSQFVIFLMYIITCYLEGYVGVMLMPL